MPLAHRMVPAAAAAGAERVVAHPGIALVALLWCFSGELNGRLFVRGTRLLAGAATLLGALALMRFAWEPRLLQLLDGLAVPVAALAAGQVFGRPRHLRVLAAAAVAGHVISITWTLLAGASVAPALGSALSLAAPVALLTFIASQTREECAPPAAALGLTSAIGLVAVTTVVPAAATPGLAVAHALVLGAAASHALGPAGFELGPRTTRALTVSATTTSLLVVLVHASWTLGHWHAARARALVGGPPDFDLTTQSGLARGYLSVDPASAGDAWLRDLHEGEPAGDPLVLREQVLDQPLRSDLRERLGVALAQRGLVREAQTLLQQVVEVDPRRPLAWALLGKLAHQRGELDKARRALERGASYFPDDPDLQNELGLVFRAAGAPVEALAAFERTVRQPSAPLVCWFNLAVERAKAGKKSQAIEAFRHFLAGWTGDERYRDQARREIERLER